MIYAKHKKYETGMEKYAKRKGDENCETEKEEMYISKGQSNTINSR